MGGTEDADDGNDGGRSRYPPPPDETHTESKAPTEVQEPASAGQPQATASTIDVLRRIALDGNARLSLGDLLELLGHKDDDAGRDDAEYELNRAGIEADPPVTYADNASTKIRLTLIDQGQAAADHMLRNGLLWAILVAPVGVIMAIRLFARERVGHGLAVLMVSVLVILGGLYVAGVFDKTLADAGLNFHECARNGLGQTYCGHELTEARERAKRIQEGAREEQQKLARESEEEQAKLKSEEEQRNRELEASQHKLAEEEAQISREGEEEQRHIEEEAG
jgi:hypothetical protein